jgi:pyrroline-5-carboxylate reductase
LSGVVPLTGVSLALVGAGNMGFAMLEGWAARGLAGPEIVVVEPRPSPQLIALCAEKGFRLVLSPAPDAGGARDVVVLAVKPQMLEAGVRAAAHFVDARTMVLSILAGKTLADIAGQLPACAAIVRAMPNTPASVGRGVTGAVAGGDADPARLRLADALLGAVGTVEWLDEERWIDALTAVSGSGPAYVFYMVECLAAAGVAAGLPVEISNRIARATVEGAGELLYRQSDVMAGTLRERVTSPGGTTAAALAILMGDEGLAPLMTRAVAAAQKRAGELSG